MASAALAPSVQDPEEKKRASALAEAWEKVSSIRWKATKLQAVLIEW